ncbi:MAG: hypothetical protein QGI32_16305, partial [Candidatus Latescibacteria bacterium]|nr:hypothetical protein [Candidatus Latescibacterota bacterium]
RGTPAALRLLADLRWEAGDRNGAILLWHRAAELRPWQAQAHHDLGFGLHATGASQQALSHLERAIEIAPDSLSYYPWVLSALETLGQSGKAAELRRRVGMKRGD